MSFKDGIKGIGTGLAALTFAAAACFVPSEENPADTANKKEEAYINHLLKTDPNCKPAEPSQHALLDCTPKEH